MEVLIASPKELKKYTDDELLASYIKKGGVIRIRIENGKVKLVYPSKESIKERIGEIKKKLREISAERRRIVSLHKKGRVVDPLYIKHMILSHIDSQYKDITSNIDVKSLLEDERGRKIIEQLQKDKEYRDRIAQALKESPVYKRSELGSFVKATKKLKDRIIENRLKELEKNENNLKEELQILEHLLTYT